MSSTHPLPSMFGRFTTILQAHDHLGKTLRQLRAMCVALEAEQELLPAELTPDALIAELLADLTAHFGAEESQEYFGVVLEEEPRLAPEIAGLKAEHMTMLRGVEVLHTLSKDRWRWLQLVAPTRELVAQLERHERAESKLLRGLFFSKP